MSLFFDRPHVNDDVRSVFCREDPNDLNDLKVFKDFNDFKVGWAVGFDAENFAGNAVLCGFMINFVMTGGCDVVYVKEGTRIASRKIE